LIPELLATAFILSISASSLAYTANCPAESIEVKYVSPVTKKRKVTCGYMKDGSLVKHGPEVDLDERGVVVTTLYYSHGKAGSLAEMPSMPGTEKSIQEFAKPEPAPTPAPTPEATPEPTPPAAAPEPLPAPAPEPTPVGVPTPTPIQEPVIAPAQSMVSTVTEEDETFTAITNLLSVLTYDKRGLRTGSFKIARCDSDPQTWVKAATTRSEIAKTYSFNPGCDVDGSFKASFLTTFPAEFRLRNLEEYNFTRMMVKMSIEQEPRGIRYRFEVKDGILSSPKKDVGFNVHYEVDVNPLTGSANLHSQSGIITLTKIKGKPVNVAKPLVFNR